MRLLILFYAVILSSCSCKPTTPRVVDAGGQGGRRGDLSPTGPTEMTRPSGGDFPQGNTGRDFDPRPSSTTEPAPSETETPPENFDSNGSGGVKGRQFEGQSDSGTRFIINAPNNNAPNQQSHGLLILLHGSGASSYRRFVQEMAQVASTNNLIPVSVLAPNGQGWNEGNQFGAADALHGFIQNTLYRSYNIDKRNIIFSGQSSGAGFLSTHFIVGYGNKYSGGAFLQCGGARPVQNFTVSPEMKQNFKLHYEITTGDTIWADSVPRAVQAYKGLGLEVSFANNKSGGHCAFDQAQVVQQYVSFMLTTTN